MPKCEGNKCSYSFKISELLTNSQLAKKNGKQKLDLKHRRCISINCKLHRDL